jgi:hypothetical protein
MADANKAAAARRRGWVFSGASEQHPLMRLTAAPICTWPCVRGGVAGSWRALGARLFQLQARLAQHLLRQAGIHITMSVVHARLCCSPNWRQRCWRALACSSGAGVVPGWCRSSAQCAVRRGRDRPDSRACQGPVLRLTLSDSPAHRTRVWRQASSHSRAMRKALMHVSAAGCHTMRSGRCKALEKLPVQIGDESAHLQAANSQQQVYSRTAGPERRRLLQHLRYLGHQLLHGGSRSESHDKLVVRTLSQFTSAKSHLPRAMASRSLTAAAAAAPQHRWLSTIKAVMAHMAVLGRSDDGQFQLRRVHPRLRNQAVIFQLCPDRLAQRLHINQVCMPVKSTGMRAGVDKSWYGHFGCAGNIPPGGDR